MLYSKISALDLEHSGFQRFEGDLMFAYCWTDVFTGLTEVFRIPTPEYEVWLPQVMKKHWHPLETDYFQKEYSRHDNYLRLQEYLSDTSIVKTVHNLKHEYGYLRAMGFTIPDNSVWHCTMIASQHLMNLAPSHALDEQAYYIYKYPTDADDGVKKITSKLQTTQRAQDKKAKHIRRIYKSCYEHVPEDLMHKYQVADGERGALLYKAFIPKLYNQRQQWLDYLNDIDLVYATVRQEEFGLHLDDRQNKKVGAWIKQEHDSAERRIHEAVGYPLNPKSPKQLAHLLVDEMGYSLTKLTKSGKSLSTDREVLAELYDEFHEPVLDDIMKCIAYRTGISTLESYTELAHPYDRKIHADHKTNEARTGRQSISKPNLQNIAKANSQSRYPIPARKCFTCDPHTILLLPDYSGIELRLIASASGEQEYIDVMNGVHKFDDTHNLSGSVMYADHWDTVEQLIHSPAGVKIPKWYHDVVDVLHNDDPKNVLKQMRNGVKSFVFGSAYGGGLDKTGAGLITLTWEEKCDAQERFQKRFPRVAFFAQNMQREVKLKGYITTAFGRKLYIEKSRSHAGANYMIQGTAAGMLKRGEVRVDEYIRRNFSGYLHEVCTVHDEMIISLHRSLLPKIDYIVKDIATLMEVHSEIKVPMVMEYKVTTSSWAAAKEKKFKVPEDWELGSICDDL